MKHYGLALLFYCLSFNLYSQGKPILVFDLINNSIDSLAVVKYDTTITSDKTNYNIGNFDALIENLEQTEPTQNVYPNSHFTYKKQASIDYDLNKFPLRTSVKLVSVQNDSLSQLCSGSFVSRRHILTAAHCIDFNNSNTINVDSLIVLPVIDNGIPNANFSYSAVSKIYYFKNWSMGANDLALLELENPIGDATGWLGFGFNQVDSLLSDGIFYKFSYPGTSIPSIDSNTYNGDTLYYNYGKVDLISPYGIQIKYTSGIPGESGSSIIKVKNNENYTSYGVLSYSVFLRHSRIQNWQFYALKDIIENNLTSNSPIQNKEYGVVVYPNPASSFFYVKSKNNIIEFNLLNGIGENVLTLFPTEKTMQLETSTLAKGIYFIQIKTKEHIYFKRIHII